MISTRCSRFNLQTLIQKGRTQIQMWVLTNSPNLYSSRLFDIVPNADKQFVFLLPPLQIWTAYTTKENYNTPITSTLFHSCFPLLSLRKVQLLSSVFKWLEAKEGLLRKKEYSRRKNSIFNQEECLSCTDQEAQS